MSSTSSIKEQYLDCFGFIFSVEKSRNSGRGGLLPVHLNAGRPWCLDNGIFTGQFTVKMWVSKLRALREWYSTCLFVVVPDVIGDCQATLERFPRYAKILRRFGYPVAFVTQDGLTPDITPWDDFDVLFVGGTDAHKLGSEAGALIDEAIRRNKWVHIGRVNSPSRMRRFWRADSWDGTHLSFRPDKYTPAIARAVREIRAMKAQPKLWEDL